MAESIAELQVNRWLLRFYTNLFALVAGLFLPPVAVILKTSRTMVPIIIQAGFDPI